MGRLLRLCLLLWLLPATSPAGTVAVPCVGAGTEITPEVSRAVEQGLAFLAHVQLESGAFAGTVGSKRREGYRINAVDVPHVGVSALAGMAFLAGGHLPDRGAHQEPLSRCLDYVLSEVNDFGYISSEGTRMYSHAFATLFLAEAYGMARRPDLEEKLTKAVNFIVSCQNEEGSWRYQPWVWQSDMSMTVCQLMALRAAHNAGLHVPIATIDRAVAYVQRSQVQDPGDAHFDRPPMDYYCTAPGAFRYQVWGDQRSSFALTAAGITSMYHAARYEKTRLRASLRFLEDHQHLLSDRWVGHYFYYYGHYYAAQAMFISGADGRTGHDYWKRYWERTSAELLRHQEPDGRWTNPVGPGDAFGTAVACVVLQTPNGYLPILQR